MRKHYLSLLLLVLLGVWTGGPAVAQQWTAASLPAGAPTPDHSKVLPMVTKTLSTGEVLVAGRFTDVASFGTVSLAVAKTGGADLFVAKFSSAGVCQWAARAGSTAAAPAVMHARDLVVASNGDIIVTGDYSVYSVAVGPTFGSNAALPSPANTANLPNMVFVARLNAAGSTWLWSTAGGGANSESYGRSLAVNAAGEVFVAGTFKGASATFGALPAITNPNPHIALYVAKLNGSTGAWTAARATPHTVFSNMGYNETLPYNCGMQLDNAGNLTLASSFAAKTVAFGSTTLVNSSSSTFSTATDVYVARLNFADGAWAWAARSGAATPVNTNSNSETAQALALDASGNVVVTGGYVGTGVFGNSTLAATANGDQHLFVAKLNAATRAWTWASKAGGTYGNSTGLALTTDASSNVYLGGTFSGAGFTVNGTALTSAGQTDVLLAKLNVNGSWLWATSAGGVYSDFILGLAADASGNLLATGSFLSASATFGSTTLVASRAEGSQYATAPEGTLFLSKLATNGGWLWTTSNSGYGQQQTGGVAVDAAGNRYVAGSFSGKIDFGSTTLTSLGGVNAFVAKQSPAGTWLWAVRGGSGNGQWAYAQGLALDASGDVLVGGYFLGGSNSLTFGSRSVAATEASNHLFVAKLAGSTGSAAWVAKGANTLGSASEYFGGLATDAAGDVYVTGRVQTAPATLTYGSVAVAMGNKEFFLGKLASASGTWAWGAGNVDATGTVVAVTADGEVGVGGTYQGSLTAFGATTLPGSLSSNTTEAFVARYQPATATWRWATSISTSGVEELHGLAADAAGNLYVGGSIGRGNLTVGGVLTSRPNSGAAAFAGKIAPAGTWLWKTFTNNVDGTGAYGTGLARAADGYGSLLLAGTYSGSVSFGTTALNGPNNIRNQYAARLNPDTGAWLSAVSSAGTSTGFFTANGTLPAIAAGPGSGAVVLAGELTGTTGFGTLPALSTGIVQRLYMTEATLPAPPEVNIFTPAAELPGQTVTLTGSNFLNATGVSFGGVPASSFTVVNATTITATVPVGAVGGALSVTTGDGSGASPAPLTPLAPADPAAKDQCQPSASIVSNATGTWRYLLHNGQVVAAINDQGADLGTVSVDYQVGTAAVQQDARGNAFLNRTWHINAQNTFPGRTVLLRLYTLSSELVNYQANGGVSSLADLRLTQYQGPNEDCTSGNNGTGSGTEVRTLTPTALSQPAGTGYVMVETSVSDHFSEFYLGAAAAPLPVELISFSGRRTGPATVALAWRTASEKDNTGFIVERSTDGQQFASLVAAPLPGAGTSTAAHHYAFADGAAAATGPLYYRLLQLDSNGRRNYSPVVAVAPGGEAAAALQLAPNPARHAVRTTLQPAVTSRQLVLLNQLGQEVRRQTVAPGTTDATVALDGLRPGLYVLRCNEASQRLVVE